MSKADSTNAPARRFTFPQPGEPVDPAFVALLAQIEREAVLLDSRYRIPGTDIRFGLDPLIGILPVVGDVAAALWSLRLVGIARQLGSDASLIRRMLWHITIDFLIGLVPAVGPVADTFYRCNVRNLDLLLTAIAQRRNAAPPQTSKSTD
ncbi:MAG: DUF4112 domain-containing protein [Hyphomicrobiaceae bacterium]|nr:DUF4112 domain-containing protein [Hyphomicrobiaceae bacterium]MCC0007464.1 DUF4112 domain-containing protein [Hyphomicrobiaceae bacterium]